MFFTAPSNSLADIYRNHFRESVEQATVRQLFVTKLFLTKGSYVSKESRNNI